MNERVIMTEALSKSYGGRAAIEAVSIDVPRAAVFGFLGPNGSGKTTTIRLLLGLQRPSAGRAEVLGHPAGDPRSLRRLGALVEVPSLYPHLTGIENLRVTGHYRGCNSDACRRALDQVGLRDAADQRVKGFSLGMKQRLSLASALMHDPELLILDEPTNGLDPAGILEMRGLIRALSAERGVTVFVSSHLLSEIEQTATHVAILKKGRVQFVGSLDSMRKHARPRLVIGARDASRAIEVLRERGVRAEPAEGGRLAIDADEHTSPASINLWLVNAGIEVDHLALERPSLESQFLEMTREDA